MISRFRRLRIKIKWLIYTFVFINLFFVALFSFFITAGKRDLKRELKKWGGSLAKNLAENASHHVQSRNYAELNSYLYGIMNYDEIIYSAILDESGSILAIEDSRSHLTSEMLDDATAANKGLFRFISSPDRNEHYCFIEPIFTLGNDASSNASMHHDPLEQAITGLDRHESFGKQQRLGTVILGVSLETMNFNIRHMRNRAIYIAVLSTLIVFGFVFWSVHRLTQPIKELERAAQLVASGNLNHSIATAREDELGNLARSFNEIIEKLKQSQDRIDNNTKTLENRMAQWTLELQQFEQK
ncbi:MAG: HAMP domain-containing protein [candidate division KSB1 bacterium]|nr:HAMP domain-containing protein [candidate division KSB1 bacterium]